MTRKVALLEERCTDAEIKLESSKKESAALQKELDLLTKGLEESENKTRDLTKQKDALSEEVLKHEQVSERSIRYMHFIINTCATLSLFDRPTGICH